MRDTFHEAIRLLLSQVKTVDEHGFVNYIHESFFENLQAEYMAHCRKHGIRWRSRPLGTKRDESRRKASEQAQD